MFTRREFLELSGPAGLAAALALDGRALVAAASYAVPSQAVPRGTTGGIREIHLETREVDWELAPGKRIKAMAFNGRIPGPEIRLKEGERARIVLKNMLREPTTIHWHGVDVPARMDGVPEISQAPVAPGGTFIYEFEARPSGTRWYHTHFQEHRQLDLGLYAPLVIEPARPDPFPFDREHTLVLDDWATGTGRPLPRTQEGTAENRGGMVEMMRRMMGRRGMGGTVPAVNGRSLAVPLTKDTVDVAPHMGSVDLEFTASNPGRWWFHCHKPMHMQGGMISLVSID